MKVRELTPVEQRYVRMFCPYLTVTQMSVKLRCRKGAIYKFLEDRGWKAKRLGSGGRKRHITFVITDQEPVDGVFNPNARQDWFI